MILISFMWVRVMWFQYLKHVRPLRDLPIFERFPVLISVTIIWVYATILTASGAYHEKPYVTQKSCRTDKADLIATAPWSVCTSILFFDVFSFLEVFAGPYLTFDAVIQVQVSVPSAVGSTYFCSRTFLCHDVSSFRFNGWGTSCHPLVQRFNSLTLEF